MRLDTSGVPLGELPLTREAIDRATVRRGDDAWLASAWADPATRVVTLVDGEVAVTSDGAAGVPRLSLRSPGEAPDGERIFLGLDAGTACFAVVATEPPAGVRLSGLRELAPVLDATGVTLAVQAVALANWHAVHSHCARCGAPTVPAGAGHLRQCPQDHSEHYPRTDPAVIMAVVDADERLLLGRQSRWPERLYSTLAGFVEPGESLEAAVRREVREEVAIEVGAVRYLGSQPWPFPASLMLGFVAEARTTEITPDGAEIAAAAWWSRADLAAAVERGDILLSPRTSIARRLIEHWYGAALHDEVDRATPLPVRPPAAP